MSIYEYDEELHERTLMEIGREEGMEEGISIGREEGMETGISIGRIEGAVTVLKKLGCPAEQITEMLMETYHLTREESIKYFSDNR